MTEDIEARTVAALNACRDSGEYNMIDASGVWLWLIGHGYAAEGFYLMREDRPNRVDLKRYMALLQQVGRKS